MSNEPSDPATNGPVPATVTSLPSTPAAAEILYPDDVRKPGDETKPQIERPDEAERQKTDEQPAPDYDLRMPDGVALDKDLLSEATPVLLDLGLTSDQASKLVPLVTKVQDRMFRGLEDEHYALKADWARQTKADPNIGGKAWPETERLCALALNAAGAGPGSEVREVSSESGLGNHPAFVRLFRSLGHQLAGKGGKVPSRAEVLYPDDVRR